MTGTVIGNDKNGNIIVRLAGSDLILSSPLALGKGAQLSLQINNVSGSMIATLRSQSTASSLPRNRKAFPIS